MGWVTRWSTSAPLSSRTLNLPARSAPLERDYDVIILGGGAAGLSAALYAGRAVLKTLILDSLSCGGQILVTDVIENYPGFPYGVRGPHLSRLMCEQATKYGAVMKHEEVSASRSWRSPPRPSSPPMAPILPRPS